MKAKKCLLVVLCVVVALAIAFLVYVNQYYRADETALSLVKEGFVHRQGNLTMLIPEEDTDTGLLFYPGAKVETEAYLPLLNQFREAGYLCVLIEMPFYMAIFDIDVALDGIEACEDIDHWFLMGHSMGGAMASQFASEHPDILEGLVLLGAYPYKEFDPTLVVYGSLNTSVAEKLDKTDHVVCLEGGNHAQFGNYGLQKGDPAGEISRQEQQDKTVEAVLPFLESCLAQS